MSPLLSLSRFRHPALVLPGVLALSTLLAISGGPVHAGDILRGGSPAGNPGQRSQAAQQATAAAAAAARANARDKLARTTRAMQSMQRLQNAAQAAASGNQLGINPNAPGTRLPGVSNGLTSGGLEVDPGVAAGTAVWSGASLPTQSSANGRTTVNIRQTQQTALLNWRTFNVGRQTTVNFDQSQAGAEASKWVAFNRINDPGNAPSQILGSIRAPGQIYLINRNGIIFGAGSQVNVGTLVASSLPINPNLVERGLLNNPDAQFLFSGIAIPAGAQGTPAFNPEPPNPAIGRYGDIFVQRGARIESPTSPAKSGGRVMLVGPNVSNAGSIRTPDGQTILVAGMQVGIAAHPSSDPSLRGLDVYVGSVTPPGGGAPVGTVLNEGIVSAPRGNITLAGREIRQSGGLDSSTSVSLNGRIDIQANYDSIPNPAFNPSAGGGSAPFLFQKTGTVRFGPGSVTRILPELRNRETAVGRELALRSRVNVTGRAIHLGSNAMIQAPSGDIRITAGEWRVQGLTSANPNARFVQSAGQVYLDAKALIDAAGSVAVPVPVLQQILALELRGAELANSPLQRAGILRSALITVDLRNFGSSGDFDWIGTPLADATGFAGLIERSIGEFTAPGGQVTISAGESIVMRPGSVVDVSGGTLKYEGGTVRTTRLLYQGRLIDIKDATPNRLYDGIYTGQTTSSSERWGVLRTYDQPLALTGERWEPSHIQGAPGGRIDLTAPSMALDGELLGRTVDGPRQRESAAALSSLRLSFTAQDLSYPTLPLHAPTPPSITFREGNPLPAVAAFSVDANGDPLPLSAERLANVVLSPSLLGAGGFGRLTVENPDGSITVPEETRLEARAGGAISLLGSHVNVAGKILAPGGSIALRASNLSLTAVNLANSVRVRPAPAPGIGRVTIGSGAVVSAAGLLADERAGAPALPPPVINGGSVTLAGFDLSLAKGSLVDVSGGARIGIRGQTSYGQGGSLSLAGGRDLNLGDVIGGSLSLDGELRGYSGTAQGGALSLSALAFQIGGGSAPAQVIRLAPSFFSEGGFSSFSLTGAGLPGAGAGNFIPGIHITAGTRLRPVADSWLTVPHAPGAGAAELRAVTLPEGLRAPVSLSFNATGVTDSFNSGALIARGDLLLGRGASIRTDAGGAVSLRGETAAIFGRVRAPGGSIAVAGASDFPFSGQALATVYLAREAVLSTAGTAVVREGRNGWREGFITGGGSISVSGNIVAEAGARLNVSGSAGVLDLPATYRGVNAEPIHGLLGRQYVPVGFHTDGGTITLSGAQMLYSDATLVGRAGGARANGGTLNVSSGRFIAAGTPFTTADENLVVVQSGEVIPTSGFARGIGLGVRDASGANLPGIGNFAVDRFAAGGFSSLTLGGNVRFRGPVAIEAPGAVRLASGGVLYADSSVSIQAGYASLGRAFRPPALETDQFTLFTRTDATGVTSPHFFAPVHGPGSLSVKAGLIDLGDLSLQGFGRAAFDAARGDIRGNGTVQMRGDLHLRAGQVYPTTLSRFSLFAYDHAGGAGSISVTGGSQRALPLSAGGTLSLHASTIHQGGTLRAPIGTIKLGWDGSGEAPANPLAGTSVAAPVTQSVTLAKGSLTSVGAVDPRSGLSLLLPFGITFDGNSWIDPAGNDITVGGLPAKAVNLAGRTVTTESGSTIDLRGGGDLFAYRWIEGNGGTRDLLASGNLFAVIPGYEFDYAPYAPFNTSGGASLLQGQAGYVNQSLRPGDRVTFGQSEILPAGTYTLLPARYALLPGAVLVTPSGAAPVGTRSLADGASLVSGYRSNELDSDRSGRTAMQRFEVASAATFLQRAEYAAFGANAFLRRAALSRDFVPPRLPIDAGTLSFSAITAMHLSGAVEADRPAAGRGALVDISSPGDILVNRDGIGGSPGTLVLSSAMLNRFQAESLLLGGLRRATQGGYAVDVTTLNITVDNAGAPLAGSDFILAARGGITLEDGASIRGTGSAALDRIVLGDTSTPGSGDGALLRVSGSTHAPVERFGVGNSVLPAMSLGAGVLLSGGSVTVDSTYATYLDPGAGILAPVLALNSGQISIQLDHSGALNPTVGLVLSGQALETIQETTRRLSLLSYSSLDLYGTGVVGSTGLQQLNLRTSAIRGYHQGGGEFGFLAENLLLENATGRTFTGPAPALDGRLRFEAGEIVLGRGDLGVGGFSETELAANSRVLVSGEGSFATAGDLGIVSPLLTGAGAARHRLEAAGDLRFSRPSGGGTGRSGGLGASVELVGASLEINGDLSFNSGEIALRATAGDLRVGWLDEARLDVSGTSRPFLDLVRHTSAGEIKLSADAGDVLLSTGATLDLSAPDGGGDAGFLAVSAPTGTFELAGTILGSASADRRSGSFTLDAASVAGDDLGATDAILNAGQFNAFRSYRLREGDFTISGLATARDYRAYADEGSILVLGTIDASGTTGGRIELGAHRDLVLAPGALLDVSAREFSAAGQGGSIFLGAGASHEGTIDPTAVLELQSGATLELGVAASNAGSARLGQFSGTVHLRAPQTAGFDEVQVAAIGSEIRDASAIVVEGYRLYDLTGSGVLDNALLASIQADGESFLGSAGNASANHAAMLARLSSIQPGLDLILAPGAEIQNRSGSLVLGSPTSTEASDWNLAGLRFGPRSAAGMLTLRAADNLDFYNALSDGFAGGPSLWLSPLLAHNPLLPANSQSWSYRMAAGADFAAADTRRTRALETLASGAGMIRLGKDAGAATATGGANATTASVIANRFQVIRTGSGNIDLHAGRSFQLLNPFASVYTAGTQVADPTGIFAPGDFVTPILTAPISQGALGAVQQSYPAQYSMAGGNVTIQAGEDLERKTRNNSGLVDDASRQLPNNWLYRRGHVGPDGTYGPVSIGFGFVTFNDPAASTTWWVDHSNFFQSVGALGGGDVTLIAGRDIVNVDAAIPTNARAPIGTPDPSRLVELGGGDLLVRSGGDLSGGTYYVERGTGRLEAGGSVTTNAARSPSLGTIQNLNNPAAARLDPLAWMPTALFLGRASFDVSARGDVLLGPMANPFLMPQGMNNGFWYKTYFSTYGEDSSVTVSSLGGDVTFRNAVTLPNRPSAAPMLRTWLETQNLLATGPAGAANTQPWLRLAETSLDPFNALLSLHPPTLEATAFDGDINLSGPMTLFPAPRGQLSLLSAGRISGFQPTGVSTLVAPGQSVQIWNAATVNVSDANPASVPRATNPFNYFSLVGTSTNANNLTRANFLEQVGRLFTDSRSTTGVFGASITKQALHSASLLHRNDPEPLRLYALGGSLSGLTLFSPKPSRIYASRDISDVSFYLQNLAPGDSTVVAAGRDIIPYNASSVLRSAAAAPGNLPGSNQFPLAGDIHLGGPGSLQVLAGRTLDLGAGPSNADGSGSGLLTIGNTRNPFLPLGGANLIVGAGLGDATSLADSRLDVDAFAAQYLRGTRGQAYLRELGVSDFDALDEEEKARVALAALSLVLRDTGRNFNNPGSPGFGNYDSGFAAIRTLFGSGRYEGEVLTRGRSLRTQSGGDLTVIAPGGGLTLANTVLGNSLVPPGIVTESGGRVSIFTDRSVDIGVGRIFTLRGGDMVIWSSRGDIAAGVASRTVQSAPPTRVLIDPQSAAVETDLAGLATGGGIGVLATVDGVRPGNVDLIAPAGIIDAGDAGIRVTGDINLAATQVLNASNIAAGGSSSGAPSAPAVSAPNVGGLTAASASAAATTGAALESGEALRQQETPVEMSDAARPSLITVEVLGYGGGAAVEEEEEEEP